MLHYLPWRSFITLTIRLFAFSKLFSLLDQTVLIEIGKKYNKSPAQVVLRWDLQNEVVTIPKSVHENRINENKNIFDFELTDKEMDQIDQLNKNERFGPDPDNFNF